MENYQDAKKFFERNGSMALAIISVLVLTNIVTLIYALHSRPIEQVSVSRPITTTQVQAKPQPQPKQVPDPITLSGSGQQATSKFHLQKGLSTFKLTYTGGSNFSVWLLDSSGNNIELLANDIGTFDGSKAVQIDTDGDYLLNVESEGQWTVGITQS